MASRPPLQGYNHNIRYKNRIYHVQTEDSGIEKSHIFTHCYVGGVIIGSAKVEYADLATEPGHEKAVKKRMQGQHKDLMKRLRRGEYDEKIVQLLGSLEGDEKAETKGKKKKKATAAAAPVARDTDQHAATPATGQLDTTDEHDMPPGMVPVDTEDQALPAVASSNVVVERPVAASQEVTISQEGIEPPPMPLDTPLPTEPAQEVSLRAAASSVSVLAPEPSFDDDEDDILHDSTEVSQPPIPVPDTEPYSLNEADLGFTLRVGTSPSHRRVEKNVAPQLPRVVVEQQAEAGPAEDDAAMIIDSPTDHPQVGRGSRPRIGPHSGVFDKPLPRAARQQEQEAKAKRSGSSGAGHRAVSRAPSDARGGASQPRAPQASSPQRYTAPTARAAGKDGRRRRTTGAYEAVRGRSAPSRRPPQVVVARPAVVVSRESARRPDRPTQTRASGARRGVAVAPKGPPVPVAPTRSAQKAPPPAQAAAPDERKAPRARSRSLPNLFGSDLISERSLDEVILHYLAEDGDKE